MHSATMPPNLQTFTCFPNLPQELRLEIWNISAEEPQIVELRIVIDGSNHVVRSTPHKLLHASSESRAVILKKYPNRLAAWRENGARHCVRFNPEVDTIVLGEHMLKAMGAIFKSVVWYRNMYPVLNPNDIFNKLQILNGVQCLRITANSIESLGLHRTSRIFTHLAYFHHSILEIQIFEYKFPRGRTCCNEVIEFSDETQRRIWYKNFRPVGHPHPHPTRARTIMEWRQEFIFANMKFRHRVRANPMDLPPLRFFGATYCNAAPRQLLDIITSKKEFSIPDAINILNVALMLMLMLIPYVSDHQNGVNILGTLSVEVDQYRARWCSKCQIQKLAARKGFSKVVPMIRGMERLFAR